MVKQEETVKIKILHGSMDYIEGTESNFTSVILLRAGLRSKGLVGWGWGCCSRFIYMQQTAKKKCLYRENKQRKERKKEKDFTSLKLEEVEDWNCNL